MMWIMFALLAVVIGGNYVRGAASRVRKELTVRKHIHVSIKIAGDGMASRADLAERRKLEDAIQNTGIGTITDSGSGAGYMDIVVAVANAETGEAQLKDQLAAAGLAEGAEIKVL
jgi:hypothetical protein